MFKRYPYKGWLFLALFFWGFAIVRYYQKTKAITPEKMAKVIENDLHDKEASFQKVLDNTELLNRLLANELTSNDVEYLTNLPFGIYAYEKDTISFWNNNKVLADCEYDQIDTLLLVQNERGKYVKRCVIPDTTRASKKLVALYPIVTIYPFENNYLQSSFEAANYIPISTRILTRATNNSPPVATTNGDNIFYLSFDSRSLPKWSPDLIMQIVLAIALLASLLWLQLITINISRKKTFWHGLGIIISIMLCFWLITYYSLLPFNLDSLTLFKPQLYATSGLLPSLGHLLINASLFFWLSMFIMRYTPYDRLSKKNLSQPVKFILGILFIVALIVYSFAFVNIISTLVIDSSISFDVSHFYTISNYTIIGLFTVGLITATSFTVVYLITHQLKIVIPNNWVKYILLAAIGTLMILLSETATSTTVSFILLLGLLALVILFDVKRLALNADLFSPQMIFWAALITSFAAVVLQYFNYNKEQDTRVRFAKQVLRQRDNITEYTFRSTAVNIAQDPVLKSFLIYANRSKRRAVNERFEALYLSGHLNKYKSKLLIFDERGRSLYNNDTLSYNTLVSYTGNSRNIRGTDLYYREDAQNGHYYLAQVPIYRDAEKEKKIGYVFIDMAVKQATGQSVYPELLQPGSVSGNRNAEGYSYGVYVDNKLLTQTSDYNFPVYLTDTIQGEQEFKEFANSSELQYKTGDGKTVFVIRYHRLWLESITLFSYLFGIQIIISLLTALYRVYIVYLARQSKSEKLINFTLRRRIHISFLGVVFVSFIIIGVITILFFTLQYKQNSRRKQQLVMQLVERATLQYLNEHGATDDPGKYNDIVASTGFKYFVTGLANAQKIDVNMYHASGVLNETSQEDIYERSLFARFISPEAYHKLSVIGQQFLIEEEQIGRLSYVSCYKPIRNREGVTLGYINVPFFSSEKELNFQISGILVGLINLYAFVFLISGILTVFITQWITRSFSIVIKSFSRFSLKKNEPVTWPYDDEIGLLVKEYNKMVKKAEENARMLAQSEREGAWREMAQQVAHEIKNPLTPMKLHIQYLQQALDNGYDNVNELAKKVSVSLIEQIENLSYIASEFSNFAKMPEARPETFELNELLQKTVSLYKNQSAVTVEYQSYKESLKVHTDKSQLLRVFNNLLENAVQAIPEDREGEVIVSLGVEGDEALIAFKDNGTGIEGDAVGHIFQPYFTTKTSGTGLGLAMTKKIIEFWKGTIRFETMPGKGTTFYITVPLVNGKV